MNNVITEPPTGPEHKESDVLIKKQVGPQPPDASAEKHVGPPPHLDTSELKPQILSHPQNQEKEQLHTPPTVDDQAVKNAPAKTKNKPKAPLSSSYPASAEKIVRNLSTGEQWTLHIMPKAETQSLGFDSISCQGQQIGSFRAVVNSGANCYLGNRVIMMPLKQGFLSSMEFRSESNKYILGDFQNHRVFERNKIVDYSNSTMIVEFKNFMSFDLWHNNEAYNGKQTTRYIFDSVFKMGKVSIIVTGGINNDQALIFKIQSMDQPIEVYHEPKATMLKPTHRVTFTSVSPKDSSITYKDSQGIIHSLSVSHHAALFIAEPIIHTKLINSAANKPRQNPRQNQHQNQQRNAQRGHQQQPIGQRKNTFVRA